MHTINNAGYVFATRRMQSKMRKFRNILCIFGAVFGVRTRAGRGFENNLGVNIDGNDIIYTVEQATFLRENGIEVADNDVIKQGILV